MGLDLIRTVPQLESLARRLVSARNAHAQHLARAQELARSHDAVRLHQRIEAALHPSPHLTWLAAGTEQGLAEARELPPLPPDHRVAASDGSQIDLDRHQAAACYLLNIGIAQLTYGSNPQAELSSHPRLYAAEELPLDDTEAQAEDEAVERALIGLQRTVAEVSALADALTAAEGPLPTVGLLDGTLILWGALSLSPQQRRNAEGLVQQFGRALDRMAQKAATTPTTMAAYLSRPGSRDVINALRVAICPYTPVDCDRHCSLRSLGERPCDQVDGVLDRELFAGLLAPGQRSVLFSSRSSVLERYYRAANRVRFFYLRLEDEVARVELPAWTAADAAQVDLIHATVWDQCRRGDGYPVALSEAHEQAVVTQAEQEGFWRLLEDEMARSDLPTGGSAKSQSKRRRWV